MTIQPRMSRLILLFLTVVAYGPALKTGFLYDDHILIESNPSLRSWSSQTLLRDFSSGVFPKSAKGPDFFRPLQIMTTRIEYSLFKLHPLPYHFTNLLLHGGCVLLLFQLFLLLGFSSLIALIASALFAAHPVIVEPMLMVSGRGEMLGFVFGLASLLLTLQRPRSKILLGAVVYLLALLSKEGAVMTPLLLAAVLFYRKERLSGYRVMIPMIAVTAGYLILRYLALGTLGPNVMALHPFAFMIRVLPAVLWEYARIILIPFDLHTDRLLIAVGSFWWAFTLGLAVIASWIFHRGPRWARFCFLWYLTALLPKAPLMMSGSFMSDHWAYPAVPALALPLSIGFSRLWESRQKFRRFAGRAVLAILLIVEIGCVYWNIKTRNTDEELYRSALQYTSSETMKYNLALVLLREGRAAESVPLLESAYFADLSDVHAGRALAASYWATGQRVRSIVLLEDILRHHPNDELTRQILGELKKIP
jgi:protein O-mannosyl-transferase